MHGSRVLDDESMEVLFWRAVLLRLRWDSGDEVTCFQWLPDLFQDPKKGDVDDLMEHNDFEDGPSR